MEASVAPVFRAAVAPVSRPTLFLARARLYRLRKDPESMVIFPPAPAQSFIAKSE
jgi:hypothetical protein